MAISVLRAMSAVAELLIVIIKVICCMHSYTVHLLKVLYSCREEQLPQL